MIDIQGTVHEIQKEVIEADSGTYQKAIVVIHHDTYNRGGDQPPIERFAPIEFFGKDISDKIEGVEEGAEVKVTVGIDGTYHAKSGRWYPKLKGIKVTSVTTQDKKQEAEDDDDMPF
jgi:hypothetical protein